MRELRLVGVEDGAVTLEALDGEKLRLPIDEQVRSAVRNAAINATSSLALTPREIQDRIRSGETISEIVSTSGVNEDFITKFAQPVLDELNHVIASALAIRITIAGDRFNDPTQVEFGELIQERLTANSAQEISWTSKRIAGGTWQLECNYTISGHRAQSVWHYEPRRFHLAPENEAAIALSNSETLDGPIAKLRSLNSIPDKAAGTGSSSYGSGSAPAAFRKVEDSSTTAVANESHTTSVVADSEPAAANTTNLLDEMRKRRESQSEAIEETPVGEDGDIALEEPAEFELEQETFKLDVVDDLPEPTENFDVIATEVDDSESVEAEPEEPVEAALEESGPAEVSPKKSRASMPSWDEIVFGTKADD